MRWGFLWAFQLVALLAASSRAENGPTFLVTCPLTIRPGLNVTLGVELLAESQPLVKVRAEIRKENSAVLAGEGLFEKGSFETLVLPALPLNSVDGSYKLHVKGYAGNKTVFSKSTPLVFESKGFSVFIQTDKPFYKPGQELKLRVVTVDLDLIPYDAVVDIRIQDPRGNLIFQWLAEHSDLGVLSRNFQISANPPLGDWSIEVQVNKQIHYRNFTVMEYVLPKFEVAVSTSVHHSLTKKELTGVITAKYTYGKPVKGTVTITLVPLSIGGMEKKITKTLKINGSVNFSFGSLELEQLITNGRRQFGYNTPSLRGPVEVVAVVTESLTGITQNGTSSVFFNEKYYTIDFYDYPDALKPSLNFTAFLKVMRYGNKPLTAEERRNNITVTVTQSKPYYFYEYYGDRTREQERDTVQVINYTLPESNIIQIEFPVLADTRHLIIKAHFLDAMNRISVSDVFWSVYMTYMQIKKSSQDIKVGIPFELTIQSNKPIKELSYLVLSRGRIVTVGKKTSTTFTLTPENSWTPVACVLVYYISDTGDIISDVLTLRIQRIFRNKVSLSWSKDKAMPSERVLLTITATESNSLIGLSVVDKSVSLLDSSHDFTSDHMVQELEQYNKNSHHLISSPNEVFEKCNLGVLSDAYLGDRKDFLFDIVFNREATDILFDEEATDVLSPVLDSPRIRTFFPETWLWTDTRTGSATSATLEVQVPDTITTWITNAFIISKNLGLGMTVTPVQLEAFQPFFLSLNLPYSVTRGEQFVLEVTIFNYLDENIEVTVTLDTSDAFDILLAFNDINATENQQSVSVPSQDGLTVLFPIETKQLGEIPITVKAISKAASDAITRKVLVKAEGIEQSYSQSLFLDLTGKRQAASKTLNFTFPSNLVYGSENAYVTVVGDIVGPSISGLESLIQMPFGCGEQNMIRFAPNIYILDYLASTNHITEEISQKAISFMIEGYQRELTFQRDDGSFSAFGNNDPSGSTWLSAFVLRCFLQARSFIYIDPAILQKTATWLIKHQNPGGDFSEPGRLLHKQLQGGNNSPVSLTAYVITALVEYPGYKNSFHVQSAANFLESKMKEGIPDNYTLTLVTYALSLVGSIQAKEGLDVLNERAEKQGELRFWKSSAYGLSDWSQPTSADIELAGYALLSHLKQNRVAEGIPVMKWLSQQRNHLGGYSSTQDTILALQALSSFASQMTVGKTELSISVTGPNLNDSVTFRINSQNRFLMQMQQIAVTQPMKVNISAFGHGFAIFQLNILYNLKDVTARKHKYIQSPETFDLHVAVKDDKNDINHVTVNVCTRYLGTETSAVSGMALMQVDLLSGFTLSPNAISTNDAIKKVENKHGKVILYFDSLNKTKMCVDIPAVRNSKVGYTQDASVSIIDYYEPKNQAVRSYNSEVMQILSPSVFCEQDCCQCRPVDGTIGLRQHSSLCFLLTILFITHLTLV
ncbi:CD109 antigen isoform X2 [Rhinatrema bivittatum]|uniref:CD109 antigen isoform X2 n=1 Tax=Rhinatrema bivittatum TaxID=194408 RepID=UPI00112830DA|nr:CD109 antigen isoform X2 [Rhinatrema bivittatum]